MKKYTKKEARSIKNAMLSEMLSPFKVQNWINKNMYAILDAEKVITVEMLLKQHGFDKKKIALTDLYQVNNKVCYLERDENATISDEFLASWYGYVKIGNYYYRSIEAANTVECFLKSLDAVNMIKEERERRCTMYAKMFDIKERETERERRRAEKEARKEASKKAKAKRNTERTARNKAVKAIIKTLKHIPLYATYTDMQIARAALSMYKAA